jgi:hypothetical protein
MKFASYGPVFNAFGEKKKIFRGSLLPRRRRYKNRPKGTASINN